MHIRSIVAATLLAASACSSVRAAGVPLPQSRSSAALAIDWNRLLLAIAEDEDGFLTLKGVRTAAMMHVAMHDVLNSITPRFETYALRGTAAPQADPLVAGALAAHGVAVAQYPDQRGRLDAELGRWTAANDDGERAPERALAEAAVEAITARRANDGWDREAEYEWHPMGPGVYAEFAEHSDTPEGFVFGAGWARAQPFLLRQPDQFRSPPPPAIDSDAYTRAFREVKQVGRFQSSTRTPDQTHLALWWKDFVESSHNRLARRLAAREGLDLGQATRLFALLNMSVLDAYVNVFDNKFHYNHWRPYTAIRWAEHDGNPQTDPEPTWTNTHGHTYAFPSYPSAHGCASAAAREVLADTFGADTSFVMSTPRVDLAGPLSGKIEMDPPTRSFSGFREAALECALSRVYLGIHFRYDSIEGNRLGARIGRYAVENFLRPLR
jgi:hypothetical protein